MFKQTYSYFVSKGGIPEECGYLGLKNINTLLSNEENTKITSFLKSLDEYGYDKIECEDILAKEKA
jgi:hypothetical protein